MQSQADIIYNHINRSCNENIEKIELNNDENLSFIINQHKYKTTNRTFDRHIEREEAIKKIGLIKPYFLKEVAKREKQIGLNIRLWSVEECARFENYFINKYSYLLK